MEQQIAEVQLDHFFPFHRATIYCDLKYGF